MVNTYLFDWGDTLMIDFPNKYGKMCDWDRVQVVDGAKEVLEYLSKENKIYIVTGALESSELEIIKAFERVNLSQYISGYFCKENLGILKGSTKFLYAILEQLKIKKENAIVIGDSLTKDIQPANEIGIKTIWLSNDSRDNTSIQTKTITNLKELL